MAMVVKNNLSAVRTLNQLNQNNSELNKRLAKVASGMKINSAGDDASGYSISERMRVQIRSLDQDLQNVQNGSAMLKTASGGVEDILNILRTMKEKAIDAANDSNTDEDRQTIQKELTQLRHTINDVALGNEYNGKRLLDGRYDQKIKYVDTVTTAVQVATSLMTSLNKTTLSGTAALDEAISSASNGKFSTTSALVENFLSDLDSSTSATAFLSDYCGIILNNTDTGAITGADAGGDTVKTAESIVPEQVAVSSWGLPTSATTIDGLTITWPTADADGTTLTTAEEHILKGLNSDWIEQSLKLVKESYGIDFNDPDATIKTISVNFFNSNTTTDPDLQSHGSSLAFVRHWSSGGNATKLELYVNMKYYNSIDTSSEDGATSDPSAGYLDRTLAHEFTHAVMAANIYSFKDLPMYLKEGTAELVHGIDDERGSGFANLLTTDRSTLERIFSDGGTSADGEKPYSAGYMLLRYLAKQGQTATGTRNVESMRDVPLVIQQGTQAGQHSNFYIKDMQTKSLTAGEIFNSYDELLNENDKARYNALDYDSDKQAEWLETLHAAANMTIDDISVTTKEDANIAIRVLDGALEYSLDNATTIGAYMQRLEYTQTNIVTMNENVTSSESTIRDADMAKEMTAYTKANVLLQAAQSMLAQANQNPNNVLSLLQ